MSEEDRRLVAWLTDLVDQARHGSEPARIAASGALQALGIAGVLTPQEVAAWARELAGGEPPSAARATGGAQVSGAQPARPRPPAEDLMPPLFTFGFRGDDLRAVIPIGKPIGPHAVVAAVEVYADGLIVTGFAPIDRPASNVAVDGPVRGRRGFAGGFKWHIGSIQRWASAFAPGPAPGERLTVTVDGEAQEIPTEGEGSDVR